MTTIRVYYNFHKKLFSVQEKVKGRWKVVDHTKDLIIRNATFKVSEAGRQRVLKEKRKNVHAFIVGERFHFHPRIPAYKDTVMYNPYKGKHFNIVNADRPIDSAKYVTIVDGKPTAWFPKFEGQYIPEINKEL